MGGGGRTPIGSSDCFLSFYHTTIVLPYQIGYSDIVQIVIDYLIQSFPQRKSAAGWGSGAGRGVCIQTGDRGERFLRKAKDTAYSVLVR